jgi:hypothetical protein
MTGQTTQGSPTDLDAAARRAAGSRSRGRSPLLPAILGGTIVALAIVGGAVLLRMEMWRAPSAAAVAPSNSAAAGETMADEKNARAARADEPDSDAGGLQTVGDQASRPVDTAGKAASDTAAGQAVPKTGAGPAVAQGAALRLRVGEGYPEEERLALIAHLQAAGHERVLVEEIPFPIALSRVGYYQSADRSAALALAEKITPLFRADEGDMAVRDYGNLMPDAEPGRLDLWIKSP